MIFDKKTFEKLFKGFRIIDCAIRNKERQAFVLLNKSNTLRFVFTYNDEANMNERYYFVEFKNASESRITFNSVPKPNYVAISQRCGVYAYDKDFDGLEVKLPIVITGTDRANVMMNTVTIQNSIYSVGYPNKLYKRIGKDNWEDLSEKTPTDIEEATGFKYFFKDLDGFSETDIYIVGGEGAVLHFDGKNYIKIPFPNEDWLHNVCCAGDGNVYVGGQGTSLYKWNKKRWECIQSNTGIDVFLDIKWFKGRLYCGENGRLRVLDNNELKTVENNYPQGNIDITPDDDLMLVSSRNKACLYDGEQWKILFDSFNY
jgi:hypothetical protein